MRDRHSISPFTVTGPLIDAFFNSNMTSDYIGVSVSAVGQFFFGNYLIAEGIKYFWQYIQKFYHRHIQNIIKSEMPSKHIRKYANIIS